MSALRRIKQGLDVSPIKGAGARLASRAAGMLSNKFISKLGNEDPEKVRAFLADLAGDETLPAEIRAQCQKLLDGISAGKSLKVVMREETDKSIGTMTEEIEREKLVIPPDVLK